MATNSNGGLVDPNKRNSSIQFRDRIKTLYPAVNEIENPLPRSWSPKDKYNYIGLSQNNLRVHYKGHGKTHKDAASVRATYPIPTACGVYYFEVKIVSKGRDGYMGIGLSAHGVNMNRLPGWDKNSYGYHGDDGHSFCSSGTGQPYGPTFTTGDIIGCGVNLIDRTAFYTKNGHHLGVAFTNLPLNLYPTVGLQTPGEVVDANFGQSPFVFDIDNIMKEAKAKIRDLIYQYPVPEYIGQWQTILQKLVSSYLVHHGYCATAEAFARSTGQPFHEEIASIKNRQRIQKLVMSGDMREAIETTSELYPDLLKENRNLLFMLKCRQFIEMLNKTNLCDAGCAKCCKRARENQSDGIDDDEEDEEDEVVEIGAKNENKQQGAGGGGGGGGGNNTININNNINNNNNNNHNNNNNNDSTTNKIDHQTSSDNKNNVGQSTWMSAQPTSVIQSTKSLISNANDINNGENDLVEEMNNTNCIMNGGNDGLGEGTSVRNNNATVNGNAEVNNDKNANNCEDVDMSSSMIDTNTSSMDGENDTMEQQTVTMNGNCTNGYHNGDIAHQDSIDDKMDVEDCGTSTTMTGQEEEKEESCKKHLWESPEINEVLQFGKELFILSLKLRKELGRNEVNRRMIQDAFSLLAYTNPKNSPVGWQLDPMEREVVCSTLNSAILEASNMPRKPPLEVAFAHCNELIAVMSQAGLGSCAFADVEEILRGLQ